MGRSTISRTPGYPFPVECGTKLPGSMEKPNMPKLSRRSFIEKSGAASTAASAFMLMKPQLVKGWGPAKLKAGLVGCGGRGTQAVVDMMTGTENIELVSMGDLFEDKLEGSLRKLKNDPKYAPLLDRVKVEPDHRFVGFEAYKKVLASDI